ncbi:MAG: trypsin-like peptidase domain-containing protein [Bacteroidales bacterium]|nr:trypsin-like peptidase domain-containing protein [Bacteroidales bacterium]
MKPLRYHLLFALWLACFSYASAQRSFGGQPFEDEDLIVQTRCLHAGAIELPAFNVDSVLLEDSLYGGIHGAMHFAHKIGVNINPENSGETFYTADGTKVWRVRIHSQGAYSLNVIFDTFRIPKGAKLFLYNPERTEILGSFTHQNHQESGEFPIAPVSGDELIIEYQEPSDADFAGELQIYEVNHDYRGLRIGGKFQYLDMPCLPHLSCNEELEKLGRSVCLLILNGDTYCTGTFINNARQDGRPYILTAAHCLYNNPDLGSRSVVFMNYESPRCMSDIQASEEFSLSDCQTRALSNEVDFALLELKEMPAADYRPYFAGWSINSDMHGQAPFTCIHHPYGEAKRYAIERDSIDKKSWINETEGILRNNHWHVSRWEEGHTWIGSSGSALFNKDGLLVGSLTGGDSGGSNGCSNYSMGDYFSRLDRAWDQYSSPDKQLKHWLDPDNSGIQQLEAFDPWEEQQLQRLRHIAPEDKIQAFNIDNFGYLFGNNQKNINAFAELFDINGPQLIYGVYLMPHLGTYSASAPIQVKILSARQPDKILAEKNLHPQYTEYKNAHFQQSDKKIFKDKENYLRFDSAVYVDEDFLLAVYIDKAVNQDFAMYGAKTSENHAYYFKNKWQSMEKLDVFAQKASMWVEPLIALADSSMKPAPALPDEEPAWQRLHYYLDQENRFLQLSYPDTWETASSLDIYDTQGKLLHNILINKNIESFYLTGSLASGLYILQLNFPHRSLRFKIIL